MKREDMSTPVKRLGGTSHNLLVRRTPTSFLLRPARELRDHDLAAFMSSGIAKFDETLGVAGAALDLIEISCGVGFWPETIGCDLSGCDETEESRRTAPRRRRTLPDLAEITSDYAFTLKVEPDRKLTMEWSTPSFSRISGLTQEEVVDREGGAASSSR